MFQLRHNRRVSLKIAEGNPVSDSIGVSPRTLVKEPEIAHVVTSNEKIVKSPILNLVIEAILLPPIRFE